MSKVVIAGIALILIVVALFPLTHSTVPSLINYQGLIKDGDGIPLDGNYAMTFRIWDASSGGNVLWSETHSSVSVSEGLFNITLGSQGGGLVQSVFSANEAWLEIEVAGETIGSRTRFTTSAYSHRVSTVDGSSGGEIGGDLVVAGKVKANDAIEPYGGIILPSGITIQSTGGDVMVIAGASIITVSPGGGISIQGNSIAIDAANELNLTAGNSLTINAPSVSVLSNNLIAQSNLNTTITVGNSMSTQIGSHYSLTAGGQITMSSGTTTNITSNSTLDLNGSMILIN